MAKIIICKTFVRRRPLKQMRQRRNDKGKSWNIEVDPSKKDRGHGQGEGNIKEMNRNIKTKNCIMKKRKSNTYRKREQKRAI